MTRSLRRPIAVGLILLGLLAGLAPSHAADAAAEVVFDFDRGVSSEDEMHVREGVRLAQDFLWEALRADVDETVYVQARDGGLRENPSVVGMSAEHALVIFSGAPGWRELAPFDRVHVVIHEFIHVFQWEYRGDNPEASPLWLDEGIADYLGYQAVIEAGLVSENDVEAFQEVAVLFGEPVPALEEMESRDGFQSQPASAYSLAYLAIADLLDGRSLKDVRRYYERLARGESWESAFRKVFRRDADAFYESFEEARRNLEAPFDFPEAFFSSEPLDGPADVEIVSAHEPTPLGEQVILIGETAPGARCTLTIADAEGERLLRQRTFADATGLVFWLWSIPDDAGEGRVRAKVGCGGQADALRFTIGDVEEPEPAPSAPLPRNDLFP